PYEVFERNSDLGGTWQTNKYPDARVDTSSYLYQFKFEKNYPWTEFFAARDETLAYLNHVVDKHGLRDAMRFNTELVSAQWVEDRSVW
ncbi:NAD(P)/FAD-dependent oxidoreductase, partial [Rhizobium leguminosarum]